MNEFYYDFRHNSISQLLKNYWYILLFYPLFLALIIELVAGKLWLAMMVNLCKIEWFDKYFPTPLGLDYDEFAVLVGIVFFIFYLSSLIFRKIWLFIPSLFFLMFPVEIIYERLIHDDYAYIGDEYILFLDHEKIGVMNCWRNTIIPPTYQWYLPCYSINFENNTKTSSLILCIFCKDDIYYALTCYEQLIPIERVVLHPKHRRKKTNYFDAKTDQSIVTLREKKLEKRKSLISFKPDYNDENVLGYIMSVNKESLFTRSNRNETEYHFVYRIGAYLGGGRYYVLGRSEDMNDMSGICDVYATSKDKKSWAVFSLQDFDIKRNILSDEELTRVESEYIEGFDSNYEYNKTFADGVCLSNRIEPDYDYYIIENQIK